MLKAPWFALIFAAICGGQSQLPGPPPGVISGSVTTASGKPVGGATLTLTREGRSSQEYSITTDAEGSFVFASMAPGVYRLCAMKRTYLQDCYYNDSGDQISLLPGQIFSAGVQLTPQAVVSGRVLDENGDPIVEARVRTEDWSGRRGMGPGSQGLTDVEGNFALGDLRAGTFYLEVEAAEAYPNTIHSPGRPMYSATYYPGVTDPVKATAIHLDAGQAVRNVEIRVVTARGHRIQGKIVTSGDVPASNLIPRLLPVRQASGVVQRNGEFAFDNLLPGSYVLDVRDSKAGVARQLVTVGEADVTGLSIQLAPGAILKGKITLDGELTGQRPRVPIVRLVDSAGQTVSDRGAESLATFSLNDIPPGIYHVEVTNLPDRTYIESIHFGDQDVTKVPIDLSSGPAATEDRLLNIVLSTKAGSLGGTARTFAGAAAGSVLVTLWKPGTDFTRSMEAVDGRFTFRSLPPGEYRIAAWEEPNSGLATASPLLSQFDQTATVVMVPESGRVTIDPQVVTTKVIEAAVAKLP